MRQENEWAIVLGVSSGAGASIALAAAEAGLHVFGMHRGNYQPQADALQAQIEALGQRCEFLIGDAAKPEGIARGVAHLTELDAGVRMYVHSIANASVGRFVDTSEPALGGAGGVGVPAANKAKTGEVARPPQQFHPKQFDKTFTAMAHSFVYWAQQLVQGRRLLPKARLYGLTNPIPQNLAHGFGLISASKAALEIYIRHLAMELGPLGFRVNLLNFGLVETPAVKLAFTEKGWAHAKEKIGAVTPAGRIQDTDEVARFLTLLLDPAADFMNGATIDFTGGQTQSLLDPIFNAKVPE